MTTASENFRFSASPARASPKAKELNAAAVPRQRTQNKKKRRHQRERRTQDDRFLQSNPEKKALKCMEYEHKMMKMVLLLRAMLFLLLLPSAHAGASRLASVPQCDRSDGTAPHRYDPLACWLWNLKVDIPNQAFREKFISVVRCVECVHGCSH